ncbi:MAG TPA: glycosyltransferase, partial [Planctomycetaceae bacterium]|jgi:glycosyltransferase involved in cell wall biosynthesis|nr:glycosyltransferase [Planctomycetaceae bacterium]
VFDGVRVVARVKPVAEARPEWKRADGGAVEFASVKHYIGVQDYLRHAREVKQSVRAAFDRRHAFILRVPSQLAVLLMPVLMRRRHPFAVEVVSDPHDAFSPGAIRHPLRPVFRRLLSRRLARDCRNSFAACYVTAESLQRRYPPGRGTESFYYSDVELNGEFAAHPRPPQPKNTWKLLTVSSLAQLYKAVDVQIDAVAELRRQGLDVQLTVVGEGKHRHELEQRASALRLGDAVSFRGQLPSGAAIRAELDQADVFLLPSRAEGLPRAMVEAMARAVPCIGSRVGGMPELLPSEDLVPAGDLHALVGKIREVVTDPHRLAQMSKQNLLRARDFEDDALQERRVAFFRFVRERTAASCESQDCVLDRTASSGSAAIPN